MKKSGMSHIFELASDHKGLLAVSGVLAALASIASFAPYVAVYYIIRDVISAYPEFTKLNVESVLGYGMIAVIGIASDVLFFFSSSICAHLAAFGTQYKLKTILTEHIAKIPLGFHFSIGSGRFRKVLNQDIEQMENFIAHVYPDMVAAFVAPVVLLAVLFIFDWRFGLVAFVAVAAAFGIQMIAMGSANSELMSKLQKNTADMTEATVEYVRGMPVLKAFGQTAHSFKQLRGAITAYTKFMLTYTMKWKISTASFMTLINNIYLFLVPVGILVGKGTKDYNDFLLNFIFYLLLAPAIASVLHKFLYVSSSSMRVSGGVESFDAIMVLPELSETEHGKKPDDGTVSFQNVSFSYSGDENLALSDVSFIARAGEVTAIVGTSGGGKSTIAHLIPRFWDVSSGRICIGNVDIREMTEHDLMRQVSFVFQDVYLFNQSIRDNIKIGFPEASDEEVIEAAKAACCDEFIAKFPGGYDTVLGEGGIHLSGGEAQRISIARAIIRNTPVLVLDEATAFADPENERLIQTALRRLMEGRTVIIIAHRLGTIKDADNILVMDKGKLAESGTHPYLLQTGGVYSDMWMRYTQSLEWGIGKEKVIS
ncbi:ABC transporter ATP-binding protein [Pseudoramibacter faecis]|uniref:ABC transporter ATP-binding protein n=1 Tax=Pseudoramibacter faecis TaxID=3108534 RepID=UPI002E77BE74|nr:ABC transporter ATP-binding protein [Pseudoramibacter sp. HA2172]